MAAAAIIAMLVAVGLAWAFVLHAAELPCGAKPDYQRAAELIVATAAAQSAALLCLIVPMFAWLIGRERGIEAEQRRRDAILKRRGRSRP